MKRYLFVILVLTIATGLWLGIGAQTAPQAPPANPISADLKAMYTGVKNNLIKMADKMPEEHYAFKATPDIRTFGGLIGHVADSQTRTCAMLLGEQRTPNASSKTSKADLVAALKESFALCDKAVDGMTDAKAAELITTGQRQSSRAGVLARMISHSNEEYGYTAVYMRLKGIVPPSSEGR
ncbi:MAG: DinB family protein [Blastocatellia bacterium]